MPHSIRTERLLLRPITRRDGRAFWRVANDPEQTRMTSSWVYPFTPEAAGTRFAAVEANWSPLAHKFAIVTDGQMVGTVGVYEGALGYWIGADFAGKGYASEAARAFCGHLFRHHHIPRVSACVYTDNPASRRILEKIGFRNLHLCREWCADRRAITPNWTFELTRERFRP